MTQSEAALSDDEFKATLARAFDAAWEPFIAMEGEAADTPENRRRLALKIVQLAKVGEADEQTLSQIGLIHLRVLVAGAKLGARNRADAIALHAENVELATARSPGLVPTQWEERGVHAFGPEAVEAMSVALDRCLEALPLHMPSEARDLLSTSIMDEAARGERDPERLQSHALDTLRARQ